jgi:hypothetical protein
MLIISREKKMIIYGVLTIFVIFFSIYFFKQASNSDIVEPVNGLVESQARSSISGNLNIDLNFFQSNKFRNLRSDKMPAVVFPVGKRDPFVPMGE